MKFVFISLFMLSSISPILAQRKIIDVSPDGRQTNSYEAVNYNGTGKSLSDISGCPLWNCTKLDRIEGKTMCCTCIYGL